jgi:hypothetical protein
VQVDNLRDVHIQATKVLRSVIQELGGSKPVYDDLSLSFEIPSKLTGAGMVRVSICTVMPGGASKDDACERTALDACSCFSMTMTLMFWIVTSLKLWKFELGVLFWWISLLRSETFMGWYIPSV